MSCRGCSGCRQIVIAKIRHRLKMIQDDRIRTLRSSPGDRVRVRVDDRIGQPRGAVVGSRCCPRTGIRRPGRHRADGPPTPATSCRRNPGAALSGSRGRHPFTAPETRPWVIRPWTSRKNTMTGIVISVETGHDRRPVGRHASPAGTSGSQTGSVIVAVLRVDDEGEQELVPRPG